jgi:hypothetical protein
MSYNDWCKEEEQKKAGYQAYMAKRSQGNGNGSGDNSG